MAKLLQTLTLLAFLLGAFALSPSSAFADKKDSNDSKEEKSGFDLKSLKKPKILGEIKKLGLTKDQKSEIQSLTIGHVLGLIGKLKDIKDEPKEKAASSAKGILKEFEKDVRAILTPEQSVKLDKMREDTKGKAAAAAAKAKEALKGLQKKKEQAKKTDSTTSDS